MNDKDMIQALKDNEKPFGLMTAEMQAKALGVLYIDLEYFSTGVAWEKMSMAITALEDHETWAYRLRPDYGAKPEIVECEVERRENECYNLTFMYKNDRHDLYEASAFADFIGFKYEDGVTAAVARRYKVTTGVYHSCPNAEDAEVLTPTHVIFQKKN